MKKTTEKLQEGNATLRFIFCFGFLSIAIAMLIVGGLPAVTIGAVLLFFVLNAGSYFARAFACSGVKSLLFRMTERCSQSEHLTERYEVLNASVVPQYGHLSLTMI